MAKATKKVTKPKSNSSKFETLTMASYALIASALLSALFIWSVKDLATAKRGVGYYNGVAQANPVGAPMNYAAIASAILLLYAFLKCKNKWEQILIGCTATAIACGYFIYLYGLA